MIHFPELFDTLLKERGFAPEELNPSYDKLHDPLLLPDMERARDRVIKAIKNGEKIVVFSDYDADGIPGAVVLADFFKRIRYDKVEFYIPHRHDEGFGLNREFIDGCDATLLITIDCGTADIEEIKLANAKGIDVIVTDHHESLEHPPAYAVVNPEKGILCGAAIVYKLVQAILAKESFGLKPGVEKWSLDMVGIATLSDMVPLVGENRVLAKFGLDVLRKSPRPGLRSLFNKLRMEQRYLTEDDVTFMITPRINAASRMGVPKDAFMLLSTTSDVEAERFANHLEKINQERKGIVASYVKAAKRELASREEVGEVIVIGNPDWKPSLLGLVANSLVEEYERPAFVFGRDGDGALKGSCRSYNGYNLYDLMTACKENFLEFGGHKGAGGFTVGLDKLGGLEKELSRGLRGLNGEAEKENGFIQIELKDIGENLWATVSQFAPFGMGNEKPIFKIKNTPINNMRQFGKTNEHLELELSNGVKAISFFASPESYKLENKSLSACNLYAHLEKSYFRNRPELRLRIVDIQ